MSSSAQKTKKQATYKKGVAAEKFAALYLVAKGYKILEKRYKTHYGEIDLIARKDNLICFVEVKLRQSVPEALESITPKMKSRIINAAQFYLSENNDIASCDCRFDVIAMKSPFSDFKFLTHIDNAWEVEA